MMKKFKYRNTQCKNKGSSIPVLRQLTIALDSKLWPMLIRKIYI